MGLPIHHKSRTKEHNIWCSMRQRCYDEGCKDYPNYGARGIRVCERWKNSFLNFLADMGECPEGMSLDRHPDMNGNYEPGNVRWASHSEQNHNRRQLKNNKSGKCGVHRLKNGDGWQSTIMYQKQRIHLGTFTTYEEAKKAREDAELKYLGYIKDK